MLSNVVALVIGLTSGASSPPAGNLQVIDRMRPCRGLLSVAGSESFRIELGYSALNGSA
jgi:hypothetical protein